MALRAGKSRDMAATRPRREPIGHIRRTQQITTYGVGSLVAIGDQSFIVSGLDSWKDDQSLGISEPRLQRALHVAGFRYPPADVPTSGDGIKVRRFPEWYSCRTCLDLQPYRKFATTDGTCNVCKATLTPSRFIVACANGHIDDFPYASWVHRGKPRNEGQPHSLKLRSVGQNASLQSVVIECACGEAASLEGALGRSGLVQLGITCNGRCPWLGRSHSETGCREQPRTINRGSAAAWFPIVWSALSIPPWSERIQRIIVFGGFYDMVKNAPDEMVLYLAANNPRFAGYTPQQILDAVRQREALTHEDEKMDDEAPGLFEASSSLRKEEYQQLRNTTPETTENTSFVCIPADTPEPDQPLMGIGQTMLVKRLREVRTLIGFARVDPPMPTDPRTRIAPLSGGGISWVPAIEVNGEGVFLTLDADRLRAWEQRPQVVARAAVIRARHEEALARRGRSIPSPVTPRYLLVHSLAHILINEWSFGAGYPAAALQERLYVDEEMAGLLIYTATSDSAGSLGGVVAQGAPDRLGASLTSAVDRALWCSADPLCMESEASGTDSLNLAACHACMLLPETSCELGNTMLDRAMLVGTPEASQVGYYAELLSLGV